jgi:hypothetical protein
MSLPYLPIWAPLLTWTGHAWCKEESLLRTIVGTRKCSTRKNTTETPDITVGRHGKKGRGKSKTRKELDGNRKGKL